MSFQSNKNKQTNKQTVASEHIKKTGLLTHKKKETIKVTKGIN